MSGLYYMKEKDKVVGYCESKMLLFVGALVIPMNLEAFKLFLENKRVIPISQMR